MTYVSNKKNVMEKKIEEMLEIERKQSEILEKQTGEGLYPTLDVDDEGYIKADINNDKDKKLWEYEKDQDNV